MDLAEWRDVISKDWRRLKDAPNKVRSDKLAVLGAVRQSGWALAYADPDLRADREVTVEAARASCREQARERGEYREDNDADSPGYLMETVQSSWSFVQWGGACLAEQCSRAAESLALVELPAPSTALARASVAMESAAEELVERGALVGEMAHNSNLVQKLLPSDDGTIEPLPAQAQRGSLLATSSSSGGLAGRGVSNSSVQQARSSTFQRRNSALSQAAAAGVNF